MKTSAFNAYKSRYRNAIRQVLDFGCGSGVMLPYLSQISSQVTAMDVDLLPLERVQKHIPLAANVEVKDAAKNGISDLPKNSFDLIIALDVLEHVKDLPRTLNELLALLKQGGQLIVSGPHRKYPLSYRSQSGWFRIFRCIP